MNPELQDPLDLFDVRGCLTDEERLIQDSVARFVTAEAAPRIRACFDAHCFPRELIPDLANLGVLGAAIQGYDCAGLNAISQGLICQELERCDSALRSFVSVQSSLCMHAIHTFGSDAQRLHFLPRMARGEVIGCFGLTEAHGGSDPGSLRTQGRRRGDDWVLNGSKVWITNGTIADIAVIWAYTELGLRGFLVDTKLPGFDANTIENKMSLRASDTAALYLTDVLVPAEALLPAAEGLRAPLSCLNQARYGIAWGALGAAQDCLATALEYTRSRELFGRPLAATQSVQIRLAEMARRLTTAQLLALQLGRLKDAGQMTPAQVSMTKWHNARMALDIARECRDLLGAAGITAEFSPIRHLLNLESVTTYEGTQTIHQLSVGRALTGFSAF
ncbi:MAG: acyl-CoA dehydrogenase family protein [Steroidobacteraceae bacterium]